MISLIKKLSQPLGSGINAVILLNGLTSAYSTPLTKEIVEYELSNNNIRIEYYDKHYLPCNATKAFYKLIKLPCNFSLLFSIRESDTTVTKFTCICTGTYDYITKQYLNEDSVRLATVTKDILKRLPANTFLNFSMVKLHVYTLGLIIFNKSGKRMNPSNSCRIDNKHIVINSKLWSKSNNWIYISYDTEKEVVEEVYTNPIQLLPIKLYDNPEELIFSGDILDLNYSEPWKLVHMFIDNHDRLPIELKDIPMQFKVDMFKENVRYCASMLEADYRFLAPYYNIKTDSIYFLMPLFLNASKQAKAQACVVIGLRNGTVIAETILPIKLAYSNIRILSPNTQEWLW